MKIPRSKADKPLSKLDETSPGYKNTQTSWWDASQLYGETEDITCTLRGVAINGKLAMVQKRSEQFLPRAGNGLPSVGFSQNWWLGLELMHTLFALEHNAICDKLHEINPDWER